MKIKTLASEQQKEIQETLERFGLSAKDQQIYTLLLELGRTSLTPLARAAHLPVTTTQSIVQRLHTLGLIDMSLNKSRHLYEAYDPLVLKRILERRLQEIANVIPLLQTLKADVGGASKIRVYYRERTTDIFHRALQCKTKMIYEIVSAKDLQDVLGESFHFTKRRVAQGIPLKSLRVENQEIKKYSRAAHIRELREAKFLPKELTFSCSIMAWDHTVAFFTPHAEGLAWTVESKSFSEMIHQLFELLWSVSRKMETAVE